MTRAYRRLLHPESFDRDLFHELWITVSVVGTRQFGRHHDGNSANKVSSGAENATATAPPRRQLGCRDAVDVSVTYTSVQHLARRIVTDLRTPGCQSLRVLLGPLVEPSPLAQLGGGHRGRRTRCPVRRRRSRPSATRAPYRLRPLLTPPDRYILRVWSGAGIEAERAEGLAVF
jgi:hypothetical protein